MGDFPTLEQVSKRDWRDGDTANVCIGQEIDVTPMQMAVDYSAIANGGKVLWPRLVERIEPQDPASGETATNFPSGLVRDRNRRQRTQLENFARSHARGNRRPGRHRQSGGGGRDCGFAARPARRR